MNAGAMQDFFYAEGSLHVGGALKVSDITATVGTPVYIYSADAMLRSLQELQSALKTLPHLICFAVKSNSNVHILKLLGQAGAGMDLVSSGELKRALHAGIPGERIVFSGVGKTAAEMEEALNAGVYSFNVESLPELELLDAVAARKGNVASVALRFNPDVDAKTHPYISTGLKKNKFGMERAEILAAVRRLKAGQLASLRLKGLSIHIGSQILSISPLRDSFVRLRKLVDQVEALLPGALEFVDLGGGLGINYKNEKPVAMKAYSKAILASFGPKSKLPRPLRILLEPGRSIAGNAGILVTQVLFRKPRKTRDFLIVDAAMNDLMRPALYGSFHKVVPLEKSLQRGIQRTTDLVGPVCESSDCFGSGRKLAAKISAGDQLAILSAGAYGFSMSSSYNTRPRVPEVLVEDGSFRIIRKRETFEALIEAEVNL
jgi:diaminopimelate decarboxylase